METPPPPIFLTEPAAATALYFPPPTIPSTDPSSSSTSSRSLSILIVIIVIASAVIVSATIYLLLRCLRRRDFSAADDVVAPSSSSASHHDARHRRADDGVLDGSLPVFTFGSVTGGTIVGGDCAVCLSRFETDDRLRLLPLCCHAFHTQCIDAWLLSNQTCPLCRSTVHPTEADVLNKILSSSAADGGGNSFRVEIGSLSRRREPGSGGRSYSVGSFEYIVDEGGHEVAVELTHRRGVSDDKESSVGVPPPGDDLAGEVAGRSWLRDYVDRIASVSSRTLSFRSSGRFFTGSSRRSEVVEDLEANRVGEEISELFRWLSGV